VGAASTSKPWKPSDLSPIDPFREPRPRACPKERGETLLYPIHTIRPLPVSSAPDTLAFFEVLEQRRSEQAMGPASIDLIGKLLWYGARVRAEYDSQYGHIQSRAAPSAGGLQCADIIVSRVDGIPGVHLYDPISHALCEVSPHVPERITQYHAEIVEAFPESTGCVITLLADYEKADAKYDNAESLLLRDSGALMATLQLCATALGCAFCFSGNLGTTLNRAIVASPEARIPVGSGIFGTRVS